MSLDEIDNRLLARYMADACTVEERERVEQWVGKSHENKKKFEECKRIWEISETSGIYKIDTEFDAGRQWRRFNRRLNRKDNTTKSSAEAWEIRKKVPHSSIHSASRKFIRVAAVLLIAALGGLVAYQNFYQPEPEPKVQKPVLREFSTNKGQRANLKLSDGTKVMLNADSKMRIPNKFASDVREVYLKGQAYFQVSENKKKPFLIHSNGSVIRVLGTSFSVRSYSEDEQVQVVVEEGRVSLADESGQESSKSVLETNEIGRFNIASREIKTRQVQDMELYLSWREGYLKFKNKSMAKVAVALERRYDVEVSFSDNKIKQFELTAFLKSRSIKNVLEVISTSLKIDYRLNENNVVFLKNS